jgi:hypothetical protein
MFHLGLPFRGSGSASTMQNVSQTFKLWSIHLLESTYKPKVEVLREKKAQDLKS